MNPSSPAQKWDVNSCDFELFELLTLFSAILWFKRVCIVVQTIMEPYKNKILASKPTSQLQNPRKQPKIVKMMIKTIETIVGECGGQVGTLGDRLVVTYEVS